MSVVIPTFQRLQYLPKAIDSALGQTYTSIEVSVSDNAMSKEVERLVASYGDERLRYRHNGGNIGPMGNAVAAYREAAGAYVATLDDDDIWEPEFLETLVSVLEADSDLVLAFCDHYVIRPDDTIDLDATERTTRRWRRDVLRPEIHRPFHRLALADRAVPTVVTTVLRKSAIDWSYFPDDIDPIYDLWIAYLAARTGLGAYYVPRRLTRYRRHGGSATSAARYNRQIVRCYDRFLADERLREVWPELAVKRALFETGVGIELLAKGDRRAARPLLVRGTVHAPRPRGAAALALSLLPVDTARVIAAARRLTSGLGRATRTE